jgi:hypothetical protein
MFDQKLLFKVMLWSLGVTAVLGVAAVLTASFDTVGRVTATAFLTSAVAAFLGQAAVRLEQSASAVKLAQAGAILFFVFALCGIWKVGNEGKAWGTALICLGSLTVAASGWAIRRQSDYRYTGLIAAAASFVSGVCWLIGVWSDQFDTNIVVTGCAIAAWSAAAAICLVGLGTEPSRPWRWIGIGAAIAGLLLSEYAIYRNLNQKWVTDWLFVIGSIVVVVIHAVLCYASRSAPQQLTIRLVAIASTIFTALLADLIVLQELQGDHFILRLTIATAIVASTSTIATAFIIQRTSKKSRLEETVAGRSPDTRTGPTAEYKSLYIECPECHQRSQLPVGSSTCPHCNLGFTIQILLAKSALTTYPTQK